MSFVKSFCAVADVTARRLDRSLMTDHFFVQRGALGRGIGVGRGLGDGPTLGVGVGLGVGVDVGVDVAVAVGVAVDVDVGVTVGVAVAVGVGVGVGDSSAQYLPPVFKTPELFTPPQTTISLPIQTAV